MKCERCEKEIPEELYSITERGLMLSATGHWAPFSFCKSCKKELDSWFFEYGKHRCDERMNDNENKTTLSAEKTTITDGDLISRDYVLSKFKEQCDRCGKYKENNGVMCRCCALDDAIDYVENAQSCKARMKGVEE
jgi:hypothetical protein